jgi:hypothetical protein
MAAAANNVSSDLPAQSHESRWAMFEWLSQQSAGQLIGLTAVLMGPLIAIVAIASAAWARVRRMEMEASLKEQMIERGMSADEIERVLAAGQGKRCRHRLQATEESVA